MNYYYSYNVWVPWDIGVESVRQSVCLQRISFFFCCSFLIIQRPQTDTFSASRDNMIPIQFEFIEQFSFDIFILIFLFVWLGPGTNGMAIDNWVRTLCRMPLFYSAASRYSLFYSVSLLFTSSALCLCYYVLHSHALPFQFIRKPRIYHPKR